MVEATSELISKAVGMARYENAKAIKLTGKKLNVALKQMLTMHNALIIALLGGNRLTTVDMELLVDFQKLRKIDLSGNMIR